MFQPQRGDMFIVPSQRDVKLRQERHVSATCRPAGAFGPGRSRAINMALLTELCRASFSVLRSSLIQWQWGRGEKCERRAMRDFGLAQLFTTEAAILLSSDVGIPRQVDA